MTSLWQRLSALVRAWRDRREDGETGVYDLILADIDKYASDESSGVRFRFYGSHAEYTLVHVILMACRFAVEAADESNVLRDRMRVNRLLHEAIQVRREIMQPEIETTMPASLREVHADNDC